MSLKVKTSEESVRTVIVKLKLSADVRKKHVCPDCGSRLVPSCGCCFCPFCGWSRCA